MLAKDWLKRFLETKPLTRPDGRPLYRYRLSDDDFNDLKAILSNSACLGVANLNQVNGWNAVFVLYAAEWWRRDYDGGSWSWEKVFDSFGGVVKELSITRRNLIVETGLRYWRREVRIINGSARYLGTIATEGGLPLNQLNKSSGWLGRVFSQVIPKYTRLRHTGTDAALLVAECDFIPKTYQNSQLHTILGDMVKAVVKLKRDHQLQDRDKPISYLDQHIPTWRDDFPLPIDDAVGSKLLADMIATAAKADDTLTMPMRSIRQLVDNGSVCVRLEFAGFIALETLKFVEPETIPGRLEVELASGDGKTRQLGIALKTKHQHKPALKMPKPPAAITGDAALLAYAIRFKHLSETLEEIPLIGGEALADDVPWVFVQREEQWELAGLASVSTRAQHVRVIYPAGWTVESADGQDLPTALAGKKLLAASGTVRLTDPEGNTFFIKTAQQRTSDYYYLEGKELPFACNSSLAFLGLPTLRHADTETGGSKTLSADKLTARPVNSKSEWQPLNADMQGVYELRHSENGSILFRKKCVLLPESFAVCFKPSDLQGSLDGTIFLDHIGDAKVVCDASIKHNLCCENDGCCLDLFAGQNPPSQVQVTLRWPGTTDMLTLGLPFPARGGQVIDADGNRQSKSQILYQDQLHGIRLRLFNEQPDRKRHLRLWFSLVDDYMDDARDIRFHNELEKQGAVIELALIGYLDWIKTLLAVSGNLDSHVQLMVDENGSELLKVSIARYAYLLKRNLDQGTVELNADDHARLSCDRLANVSLKAMRLSQPEQEHIELEAQQSNGVKTGCWLFQPEKRVAEPWLIYPAANATVALRPIVWAVGYEADTPYHADTGVTTLHSAVKIGPTEARRETIQRILLQMSQDFSHSGWDYLRQLWRHCPFVPLSSFDVWSIAAKETPVLAALVLQMDEDFIEKLNAELPVFWELIPLRDWQAVYAAYQDYLLQVMEAADVNDFLVKRIDKLTAACPSLDVVAKILKQSLCGSADQELGLMALLPLEQLTRMFNEQRQDLDRRQADSNWPTVLKPELIAEWRHKTCQQFGLKLEDISDHHHAVIALPILLAGHCANANAPTTWLDNPSVIFKLKCLKSFDEDWFNTIFKWALAYFAQQSR